MPEFGETTIRVRYAETDQMGIAYHANFFIWFEVGRVELLRQLGFSYREMESADECYIPVVDARCRFRSPARYDDVVLIRTRLKSLRGPMIHFAYEALRPSDGTLCAEGESFHVVTDRQMNIRKLPEKYRQAFEQAAGAAGRPR